VITRTYGRSDAMSGKTEQFIKGVRKSPVFTSLVALEAGTGWPYPVRKGGRVYVTVPFFGCPRVADQKATPLYPPFATITAAWSNGLVVEYSNLRFRNPWPEGNWEDQVGTFPHDAISRMTVGEYKAKRAELLGLYDEMFDTLQSGGEFSDDWTSRFEQLLRTLMEPSLEPYYRAIAPKFFDRFLPASVTA
jgi:hypothetical protein